MKAETVYPMRLVTRMTGLTSDTIRAWERRYGAINPTRTGGNTRQFSAEDVRRLTLLKEVTDLGHSISSVANVETEALEALVADTHPEPPGRRRPGGMSIPLNRICESYLAAVTRFDTRRGYEILRRAASALDPQEFVFTVAVPVIQDVGTRWTHGELGVAHEHIVSAQLSALLSWLPTTLVRDAERGRVVLTTPPGHRHEFGILVAGILCALHGYEVVNLGADLPYEEMSWAVQMSRASIIVLSVVRDVTRVEREQLEAAVGELAGTAEVWLGCPVDHVLATAGLPARVFHSYAEFARALSAPPRRAITDS